jgi:hypothetical protein
MLTLTKNLLLLTLTLGVATAAMAVPNFLGPTGLIFTPSAQTLQEDQYNASLNLFNNTHDTEYALNYGIRPNIEVGFSRLPEESTVINAKYNFQPETDRAVGLAVGVMDLTDQNNTTLYGVASKKISFGDLYNMDNFRANLGLGLGGNSGNIPLRGLFGGLSFDVAKRATVLLEHDGQRFNIGARADLTHGFDAQLAFAGADHNLVFGVSYNGQL